MKIREFYTLHDDVYRITIYTEDWSQKDKQLITEFGEPEIQQGGVFTGPPEFSLPTSFLHVMSESPFVHTFDGRDYTYSAEMANVWGDKIKQRISDGVTTLRANVDTYIREEVTNV